MSQILFTGTNEPAAGFNEEIGKSKTGIVCPIAFATKHLLSAITSGLGGGMLISNFPFTYLKIRFQETSFLFYDSLKILQPSSEKSRIFYTASRVSSAASSSYLQFKIVPLALNAASCLIKSASCCAFARACLTFVVCCRRV